jgi:hypothetical protein
MKAPGRLRKKAVYSLLYQQTLEQEVDKTRVIGYTANTPRETAEGGKSC